MTIANRSELRSQVADFLGDRTDLTASQINTAISLAESEFNRKLRVLGNEDEVDLILSNKATNLPSDFKGIRRVYLEANPALVLKYYSAQNFWNYDQGTTNGLPRIFTVEGDKSDVVKKIVVSPTPDTSYTAKVLYFGQASLSNDTDTNTLLTNHPDLYLYGSMKHTAVLLQDFESASLYSQQFEAIINAIDIDDNQERIGSMPLEPKSCYNEGPYRSYT